MLFNYHYLLTIINAIGAYRKITTPILFEFCAKETACILDWLEKIGYNIVYNFPIAGQVIFMQGEGFNSIKQYIKVKGKLCEYHKYQLKAAVT